MVESEAVEEVDEVEERERLRGRAMEEEEEDAVESEKG